MSERRKTEAERAAYWNDAQFVVVDTGIVKYGCRMIGRGRWAALEVGGVNHGIVWTDDDTNLGVTSQIGTDSAGHRLAIARTRAMAAAKIPTSTAFDQMVQDYHAETIYMGLLEDLYAS
ncbi:hypothetical protein [Nocardia camponoti]|uniref:hypothetical protein n=1 Tax=Nocardia camponoti TaxID=1616106 RepID=UPI00166B7471|nr:hypothetical protein [Nocardia camponoti]